MNTFARASVVAAALFLSVSSAVAQYPGGQIPPAGDCDQIAAESGGNGFWRGRFSGSYVDFFDIRRPVFAQGCFQTERACRRWINEVQSAVLDPGAMSCRLVYPR